MNNIQAVRVVKCVRDLFAKLQRLVDREPSTLRNIFAKCRSLDKRHNIVELAFDLTRVVQGNDVGVIKARRYPYLLKKSTGAKRCSNFRMHHLERDGAIVALVLSPVYDRHSTAADLLLDSIVPGNCQLRFFHTCNRAPAQGQVPSCALAPAAAP